MIRTILVGVDGSAQALMAEGYAFWFARRFDAVVRALHVLDIVAIEGSFFHDVSGSLGFEPYIDFSSKMREALRQRGELLLGQFRERAAAAGVRGDTSLALGVVGNEIAEQANLADLVVIGHHGVNERFTTGLLGSTAENVTRRCPKPVLVASTPFVEPKRALLAYDGSPRAAAAMKTAAECCAQLGLPLTVLTVADRPAEADDHLASARKYLGAYDLGVTFEVRSGPPAETIVDVAGEGFDLLFIGAFGQNRLLEFVLGSTTEYVLRNSPCPVFLNR